MLIVERAGRLGAALASLVLLFLAVSWSGLWVDAGVLTRMAGVALLGAAALTCVAIELARGPPSRRAALKRLDAGDESSLRAAQSLDDRLADESAGAETAALWALHRRRLERRLAQTPIAPPRPGLPRVDPYALRLATLIAAIAAGFAAGDDKLARLSAAFDWRDAGGFSFQGARFDTWLDPPPYTGRAQIVLGDEPNREAPVNSVLHVRPGGAARVEGALAPLPSQKAAPSDDDERAYKLTGAARLAGPRNGVTLAVIADLPPTIELSEPPRLNLRGTMTLSYTTSDDYGVIAAEAQVSRPGAGRTLYPPPQTPLELPREANGRGNAHSLVDLSESPWAGAVAMLTLVARDEGGNEGRSAAREMTLPERRFTKPLARLLAIERRALAMDPDNFASVRQSLMDLTQTDEFLSAPSSVFLGMRLALRGLQRPKKDDDLREVADLLWAMAVHLEDGDLADAERELRQAQHDLNEALARGADDEEVAKLSQKLREAMDKFMRSAMQRARDRAAESQQHSSGDAQEISKDDLDRLLDEIDAALKSGDTALAQKLLDELSSIMENLQTSQTSGQGKASRKALSDIDELAREEQQLRDETYQGMTRQESGGRPQSGRGGKSEQKTGEQKSGGQKSGAERQRALRERLESELDALRHSEEGAPSELDDAEQAMEQAERSLEQGAPGARQAVEAEGRAVQALRRGADALAQRAEGQGQDEAGQPHGRVGDRDPLGRLKGRENAKAKYDPLGLPPAQRVRRLQEELRRRLGQPERPPQELDYLQRLLPR
ncbi:MAG TPA: TIGR02302 family protein [Methylocystis sp.]|nr:TIGR02302 family protein [Methylocystis sp.]